MEYLLGECSTSLLVIPSLFFLMLVLNPILNTFL